jgi:nitroreductase
MQKTADNDFPILDQLRQRWSPRAFSSRPVPPESVRSLFEAARWAPSCFNAQPWRFIVAEQARDAEFAAALTCLNEGNRGWAAAAPLLLFAVAQMQYENGSDNLHAFYDTGQAMACVCVQATALGLFVHQMGGILFDLVRTTYALPDGFEPVCAAAIGYGGDVEALADDVKEKERAPRERKPLSGMVFAGSWGQPAPL